MMLPDVERDAIGEILNIAVGRAASALNEMVDEEVALSTPSVEFHERNQAATLIDNVVDGPATAVKQGFEGPFQGEAILIFPQRRSLELVRSILGETVVLDTMTELEREALLEVGNVILNACLSTIADLLGREINGSLPSCVAGCGADILGVSSPDQAHALVMVVRVDFALRTKNIDGYLAFLLDIGSTSLLQTLVDRYLERVLA